MYSGFDPEEKNRKCYYKYDVEKKKLSKKYEKYTPLKGVISHDSKYFFRKFKFIQIAL